MASTISCKCAFCLQYGDHIVNTSWNRPYTDYDCILEVRCTFRCQGELSSSVPFYYCLPCMLAVKSVRNLNSHIDRNKKKLQLLHHAKYNDWKQKQVVVASNNDDDNDNGDNMMITAFDDDSQSIASCDNTFSEPNVDDSSSETAVRTQPDWLDKLGQQKDLGRVPDSFTTLKNNAGFDDKSTSPEYYWAEHEKKGRGLKYLIANAWGLTGGCSQDEANQIADEISDGEAQFTLKFCNLLLKLTETEQVLLADIIVYALNAKDDDKTVFKKTNCPCTVKEFKKIYLTGKDAVIPNLPHPVPQTTQDGTHAYTRLSDVIANLMASATPVEEFSFASTTCYVQPDNTMPTTVSSTRAAFDLYSDLADKDAVQIDDDFVLYLWFKEWRDDFDPFNTKASRNQVWTCTNTICPPRTEKRGKNTFFMAISGKGDDHKEVEIIFREELEMLSTNGMTVYHGGLKRLIKVKVGKLMSCVDRPERAAIFRAGDHSGNYSLGWGHAAYVDGFCKKNHLPSCDVCREARFKQSYLQEDNVDENSDEGSTCDTCSNWNLMDIKSAKPSDWPTKYDSNAGAPLAPAGREIDDYKEYKTGEPCLPTIKLTITWMMDAIRFAHHNMKTRPPDARRSNQRFWTKKNLEAYLRTCAFTSRLMIDDVYKSAVSGGDVLKLFPPTWFPHDAVMRAHYAPMHTLFLGHGKSNCELTGKWQNANKILATFGKQANKYLRDIQSLRCRKYYDAHPFSTSSWGTGVWVSENYLFWTRAQTFFIILPAVQHKYQQVGVNDPFRTEAKIVMRFALAAYAAMSRIMSAERTVDDLDFAIKIYMDTMFELDRLIMDDKFIEAEKAAAEEQATEDCPRTGSGNTTDPANDDGDDNDDDDYNDDSIEVVDSSNTPYTTNDQQANTNKRSTSGEASKQPKKKKKKKFEKKPAFNKPNSIGILSAAESHSYFGPAKLHWEGGFAGERKISDAKQLMGIKRGNADWQTISLRRLYQLDALSTMREKLDGVKISRELEGTIKVYKDEECAEEAIANSMPISALLDVEGNVWIAHRPIDGEMDSRSAISLLKIGFKDDEGELVAGMCWCSPIIREHPSEEKRFSSRDDLEKVLSQSILMLPLLNESGEQYCNRYYCIGSNWTERKENGQFSVPSIRKDLFTEWLHDNDA